MQAIGRAHASAAPGHLQAAAGELLGANINRSPTAYLANPAAERVRYAHDTDKTLTLLKVLDADGRCAPLRRSCGTGAVGARSAGKPAGCGAASTGLVIKDVTDGHASRHVR
jgi:hypothetical protein